MYRTAYRLATTLAYAVPLPKGALRASIDGRRAALERWTTVARTFNAGPLVWVHGASIGELTAADPVIRRLRRDVPGILVVATYSSPSASTWRPPPGLIRADFVPSDRPADVARILDALRPALLLFSRGDVWPELVLAAAARRIPWAVVGATVRPRSARLSWPARSLYAEAVRTVSWVGAVTSGDADRWIRLGVPTDRVTVTGDPRHEAVLDRVPHLDQLAPIRRWLGTDVALIAGSAELRERGMVFEAARTVLHTHPTARLIVVPHRTDTSVLARWRRSADAAGVDLGAWAPDGPDPPDCRAIVVAGQGLLADLYTLGALAYVGGGFRRRGLHAVAEPAAWALPVVVGPCWRHALDAASLVETGGAVYLPRRHRAAALRTAWSRWLTDGRSRVRAGLAARRVLRRGATRRTVLGLRGLLGGAP